MHSRRDEVTKLCVYGLPGTAKCMDLASRGGLGRRVARRSPLEGVDGDRNKTRAVVPSPQRAPVNYKIRGRLIKGYIQILNYSDPCWTRSERPLAFLVLCSRVRRQRSPAHAASVSGECCSEDLSEMMRASSSCRWGLRGLSSTRFAILKRGRPLTGSERSWTSSRG